MALIDWYKVITKTLAYALPFLIKFPIRKVRALLHDRSWRNLPDSKNVVVLGGSYAGVELARKLAHMLPTGYKVILVEKNSHLNHVFNFPRYSVMGGEEDKAFVSYKAIGKDAPKGIFEMIQDTAVEIHEDHVLLASGRTVEYCYLAIATGTSQPVPGRMPSTERDAACAELRDVQKAIETSHKIAVIGGGAVGVELASDIKDFYPKKNVTIIHSRDRLMNKFGPKLSDYVKKRLEDDLNIRVMLNERPEAPEARSSPGPASLKFASGDIEEFDLVVPCTGPIPNSSPLAFLAPEAISPSSGLVLVRPTLQIHAPKSSANTDRVFAMGDVADHGGPHMSRVIFMQSHIVADNIVALIQGKTALRQYNSSPFLEGAIKLTLGKTHAVMYAIDADGDDVLMKLKPQKLDLDVDRVWAMYGVSYEKDRE